MVRTAKIHPQKSVVGFGYIKSPAVIGGAFCCKIFIVNKLIMNKIEVAD